MDKMDYLSNQPKDVLYKIMSELSYPDLMRLALCSKKLNSLSDNESFWNRKTQKDYSKPLPTAKQRYCYIARNQGYYFGSKVTLKALRSAIDKDEKEIFKYYIHKCPTISEYIDETWEDYDEQLEELTETILAYMVTCCCGWTKEDQKLLGLIFDTNSIRAEHLNGAMYSAIKSGNLSIIKYLMNNGFNITTLDSGGVAKDIIDNENIDVISYCLLMNVCTREDIIDAAIRVNKVNILKTMIEDEGEEMEYVIIKAAEYNAFEIIKYALNHIGLTYELAINALRWSTNNGNIIITEYLLNSIRERGITFEKEELIGFINLACKSGSREILQLLLDYCSGLRFTPQDLNLAINWVINQDNLAMLKLLMQITKFDLKIISATAARSRKYNIVNYCKTILGT